MSTTQETPAPLASRAQRLREMWKALPATVSAFAAPRAALPAG